jgi:hypothetical protein
VGEQKQTEHRRHCDFVVECLAVELEKGGVHLDVVSAPKMEKYKGILVQISRYHCQALDTFWGMGVFGSGFWNIGTSGARNCILGDGSLGLPWREAVYLPENGHCIPDGADDIRFL